MSATRSKIVVDERMTPSQMLNSVANARDLKTNDEVRLKHNGSDFIMKVVSINVKSNQEQQTDKIIEDVLVNVEKTGKTQHADLKYFYARQTKWSLLKVAAAVDASSESAGGNTQLLLAPAAPPPPTQTIIEKASSNNEVVDPFVVSRRAVVPSTDTSDRGKSIGTVTCMVGSKEKASGITQQLVVATAPLPSTQTVIEKASSNHEVVDPLVVSRSATVQSTEAADCGKSIGPVTCMVVPSGSKEKEDCANKISSFIEQKPKCRLLMEGKEDSHTNSYGFTSGKDDYGVVCVEDESGHYRVVEGKFCVFTKRQWKGKKEEWAIAKQYLSLECGSVITMTKNSYEGDRNISWAVVSNNEPCALLESETCVVCSKFCTGTHCCPVCQRNNHIICVPKENIVDGHAYCPGCMAGDADSHHPSGAKASMTDSVKETIDVDGIEQTDKVPQKVTIVVETAGDETLAICDDKGKDVPVLEPISATGGAITSNGEQVDKEKGKDKVPPVTFLEGIGKNEYFAADSEQEQASDGVEVSIFSLARSGDTSILGYGIEPTTIPGQTSVIRYPSTWVVGDFEDMKSNSRKVVLGYTDTHVILTSNQQVSAQTVRDVRPIANIQNLPTAVCKNGQIKGVLVQGILQTRAISLLRNRGGSKEKQRARGVCTVTNSDGVRVGDVRYLYDGTLVLIVAVILFDQLQSKDFPSRSLVLVAALTIEYQPFKEFLDSEMDETDKGVYLVTTGTIMKLIHESHGKMINAICSSFVKLSETERIRLIRKAVPLLTANKGPTNLYKADLNSNSDFGTTWSPGSTRNIALSLESKSGPHNNNSEIISDSKKQDSPSSTTEDDELNASKSSRKKTKSNPSKKVRKSEKRCRDQHMGEFDDYDDIYNNDYNNDSYNSCSYEVERYDQVGPFTGEKKTDGDLLANNKRSKTSEYVFGDAPMEGRAQLQDRLDEANKGLMEMMKQHASDQLLMSQQGKLELMDQIGKQLADKDQRLADKDKVMDLMINQGNAFRQELMQFSENRFKDEITKLTMMQSSKSNSTETSTSVTPVLSIKKMIKKRDKLLSSMEEASEEIKELNKREDVVSGYRRKSLESDLRLLQKSFDKVIEQIDLAGGA